MFQNQAGIVPMLLASSIGTILAWFWNIVASPQGHWSYFSFAQADQYMCMVLLQYKDTLLAV